MKKKLLSLLLLACLLLSGCANQKTPEKPVAITVWNYYSGVQQATFQAQVDAFNRTVGLKENIVVTSQSKGSITSLYESVEDSFRGKVGAEKLPDAFSAYTDSAWNYAQKGMLADLSAYCTQEELSAINPSYLAEGRLGTEKGLYILPVRKSTEALYVNWTEWEPFAAQTGVTEEDLTTWEGLCRVAERYYTWSGGKPFFGRDAYANYLLVGSAELGDAIFQATKDGKADFHLSDTVLRRLWENFCVPFGKGYFDALGRYRSDDMKTGNLIAYVGATSSATFTPTQVTTSDGQVTDITVKVFPVPSFEGVEKKCAVQQGAGMVVVKSDENRERATVTFLRYLMQPEVNIPLAVQSSYMPVTNAAVTPDSIHKAMAELNIPEDSANGQSLLVSAETMTTRELIYTPPFENEYQARNVLENQLKAECEKLREQITSALSTGLSMEEASAKVFTEEAFEAWKQALTQALTAL